MVATPSSMVPLGSLAPDFSLVDTRTGTNVSLENDANSLGYVVAFACNHCPYVLHIQRVLVALFNEFVSRNIACFAISANDAQAYPADSPVAMRELALEQGYQFPYMYDETQSVARAYGAVCTPDFFVFNRLRKLVYRGQFDASRPNNTHAVDGADVRHAVECVIVGTPNEQIQVPSLGCNIKWKNT